MKKRKEDEKKHPSQSNIFQSHCNESCFEFIHLRTITDPNGSLLNRKIQTKIIIQCYN